MDMPCSQNVCLEIKKISFFFRFEFLFFFFFTIPKMEKEEEGGGKSQEKKEEDKEEKKLIGNYLVLVFRFKGENDFELVRNKWCAEDPL